MRIDVGEVRGIDLKLFNGNNDKKNVFFHINETKGFWIWEKCLPYIWVAFVSSTKSIWMNSVCVWIAIKSLFLLRHSIEIVTLGHHCWKDLHSAIYGYIKNDSYISVPEIYPYYFLKSAGVAILFSLSPVII